MQPGLSGKSGFSAIGKESGTLARVKSTRSIFDVGRRSGGNKTTKNPRQKFGSKGDGLPFEKKKPPLLGEGPKVEGRRLRRTGDIREAGGEGRRKKKRLQPARLHRKERRRGEKPALAAEIIPTNQPGRGGEISIAEKKFLVVRTEENERELGRISSKSCGDA